MKINTKKDAICLLNPFSEDCKCIINPYTPGCKSDPLEDSYNLYLSKKKNKNRRGIFSQNSDNIDGRSIHSSEDSKEANENNSFSKNRHNQDTEGIEENERNLLGKNNQKT